MVYKIKSIEVEGFRGIAKKQQLELDKPAVLLYGGNHQGKSSILNALEWCLFGDSCIGQKSGIQERVGSGSCTWRVVNDNSANAKVKLVFEYKDKEIIVVRTETKGEGKKGKALMLSYGNEKELFNEEAEAEILNIFNTSHKDFSTTIYQHQENIRDFIIQRASERSDAIDRLLGLSDYRNILEGIKKSDIGKIQKKVAENFDNFQASISEAIKIRKDDIKEKEDEAIEIGVKKEDLNQRGLIKLSKIINKDLEKFSKEIGVAVQREFELTKWEEAQSFINSSKEELNRLWSESPDVTRQSEETTKKEKLESLKSIYQDKKSNINSAEKELKAFIKNNGSIEKINKKIIAIDADIKKKDSSIKKISPKADIFIEGINYLEKTSKNEIDICPLCGKKTKNLIDFLKDEYEKNIKSQIEKFEEDKNKLIEEKDNLSELMEEHETIVEDINNKKKALNSSVVSISETLDKKISSKDDPAAIISVELEKVDKNIKDLSEAISKKRGTLDSIEKKIKMLDSIYEVIAINEKLEKILEIQNTDKYKKQEEIKDSISTYVNKINKIVKLLGKHLHKEAKEKVEIAKNKIDQYFNRIAENPGIEEIELKVGENKRTGLNFYSFEDQTGMDPIPILSQGDLNSLAISIFLGLASTLKDSNPMSFALMDDPSQSLDSREKKNLVNIINDFCKDKNIIISTMDEEFRDLLKNNITKTKSILYFKDWSPSEGPRIYQEN
jgi:DNA repair protein SbcC/Rad50